MVIIIMVISCFIKIQIGLNFLVLAFPGCPEKEAIIIPVTVFMVLSSWRGHCESSPGSFDECRLSAGWPPTLRPSQPTWTVSLSVGWCHPYPPSLFISII